ncbi:hypothetical protein GUITHDRAFT_110868 [Guillardia theta CCMP2712]|uniref:Uncharacterized protein n=2 Tax=Guillardia theta TaxID=55529 RepID=L1J3P8_GUITC|nr:hypothetical protein GUITHDRAFT_110868 [Guillardia theta CCMP2712]EKX43141.1 hypothetical protein GUITHDRAFT_110868 [Guillardia theta CCMP2712]|mmetsp:Transcript_12709/g.44487  ORF Transcript_12709/g.44487 Transcript_12709/m.44487 type:complete len:683 (+) Transcript_12709:215-2263(+)|eukprot:XP_005830121.1 hypothetical protein GUITHDRAFT_110868 [Guillardia theta CCMP2712]
MPAHPSRLWKIGAAGLVLAATVCLFALTAREDQAASLFGRWSPQSAIVSAPEMGVNAAKRLHSLFQQQRWAQLFSQAAEQRKELTQALSPLTFRNGRYPSNVISEMGRNEQLRASTLNQANLDRKRAAPPTGPPLSKRTQLSAIPYATSSSEQHPADFNVYQTYDYLPAPEGYGVSDEDAAKMWRESQRDYLERNPSTTTYPAVPVVFREDPDGGHTAATSYPDDYVEGSTASESPTWFQSSKSQLLRDSRHGHRHERRPVRSVDEDGADALRDGGADRVPRRRRSSEPMDLHANQDKREKTGTEQSHREVSSESSKRPAEGKAKRPPHVDAAIAALYRWEREHGVDDQKAWEDEGASKQHVKPAQNDAHSSHAEDMFEIRKALSDIRDFEDKTEKNTESLKSQIKKLAVKEGEVEHHIRSGLLQDRKNLAAQRLYQKKLDESRESRHESSPSFYHQQSTQSLLQKVPRTDEERPAEGSSHIRSEKVDVHHDRYNVKRDSVPSQTVKTRKSSAHHEKESHIKIPKEVLRQADQLIKQKAVQEMAKEDERSIEDDTNFIFGGMDKDEEGHSSTSGGFTRLHSIEKSILEKLIQKHDSAEKKKEAEERLKKAAMHKVKYEVPLAPSASTHKPNKAVVPSKKEVQAPAPDSVQSRALEFVKAFDGIGGHAEHSKFFNPVDRDAML